MPIVTTIFLVAFECHTRWRLMSKREELFYATTERLREICARALKVIKILFIECFIRSILFSRTPSSHCMCLGSGDRKYFFKCFLRQFEAPGCLAAVVMSWHCYVSWDQRFKIHQHYDGNSLPTERHESAEGGQIRCDGNTWKLSHVYQSNEIMKLTMLLFFDCFGIFIMCVWIITTEEVHRNVDMLWCAQLLTRPKAKQCCWGCVDKVTVRTQKCCLFSSIHFSNI